MTETDEDGHFRFHGLMPGTYYLAAGPREGETQLVVAGDKQKSGFPHMYYPGVPGTLLRLQPSSSRPASRPRPISRLVRFRYSRSQEASAGQMPDQGVGFQVLTPSGDEVSLPTNFNMETGVFSLEKCSLRQLPATRDVAIRATTVARRSTHQRKRQSRRTAADAGAVSIDSDRRPYRFTGPIGKYRDHRSTSATIRPTCSRRHQYVGSILQLRSGTQRHHLAERRFRNVYSGAQAASAVVCAVGKHGQTNALYDDITVAAGQNYPLDVVLRDDSASVSGTLKSTTGTPVHATVVAVPQPISKVAPHVAKKCYRQFQLERTCPGRLSGFRLRSGRWARPG